MAYSLTITLLDITRDQYIYISTVISLRSPLLNNMKQELNICGYSE